EARKEWLDGTRYWPVRVADERARADADFWERRFAALPQTPFATTVDEPRDATARAEARRLGEAMGKHAKLLRVVTAAPSPDFGDAIDVFVSPASRPPHRWTYNGAPPSAGSLVIDSDGTALRTWGWIAARYDVELWYAWEGTYYADRYNGGGPTDVLDDPLTFDQRRKHARDADWGNGDGVLVYPGAGGPWPSLRLKALRRGLQDRALLGALARCGAGDVVARETHALVPRALDEGKGAAAWPSDEAPWEAARARLYDAWRARCAGGAR
ncbi:MAG TPA: glycoside hydrolase domain-containing protein, partial [Polyangia bacterium]